MLAQVLHGLAGSPAARSFVLGFPPAVRVSRRFVAGESLDDAMPALRALTGQGLLGMLDQLGESVHDAAEARRAAEDYLAAVARMRRESLRANLSLKLTQMGLDVSEDLCLANTSAIVEAAIRDGHAVELDMESSAYTDRTLAIHRRLHERHPGVGVAIQANLRRTPDDARRLRDMGARVRLVKGAYLEPAAIAWPRKQDVDAAYRGLLDLFLSPEGTRRGCHTGVASHDPAMLERASDLAARHGVPANQWEYQMLYGIARERQTSLSAAGFRVRVYVTYGTQWYPYFMRRLAERPANLWFLLKNLIAG